MDKKELLETATRLGKPPFKVNVEDNIVRHVFDDGYGGGHLSYKALTTISFDELAEINALNYEYEKEKVTREANYLLANTKHDAVKNDLTKIIIPTIGVFEIELSKRLLKECFAYELNKGAQND